MHSPVPNQFPTYFQIHKLVHRSSIIKPPLRFPLTERNSQCAFMFLREFVSSFTEVLTWLYLTKFAATYADTLTSYVWPLSSRPGSVLPREDYIQPPSNDLRGPKLEIKFRNRISNYWRSEVVNASISFICLLCGGSFQHKINSSYAPHLELILCRSVLSFNLFLRPLLKYHGCCIEPYC